MSRLLPLLLVLFTACAKRQAGPATTPCVLAGVSREARCFELEVPEDPDRAEGRRLKLRVAVVPATGVRPLTDPIFVLAGGPGQAASDVAAITFNLFVGLDARRDVVFVDQRGTGQSSPLLCPEQRAGKRPIRESVDEAANEARLERCRERFSDAGVDLAQYATWIAVKDLEAVRVALGAPVINLWGGSYGTRVALEYARQFPDAVRAMVLDGVAPALRPLPVELAFDTDLALEHLLRRADAGALEAGLAAVLAPDAGAVRIEDPYFGDTQELTLSNTQRLGLVRGPLYAPMLASVLPEAVTQATRTGDWSALAAMSAGMGDGALAMGMHFSVICAEDVPRITDADRQRVSSTRAGTAFIDHYDKACRRWPVRPVPEAFFAAPTHHAPTLVLSGGADPATPPRHGEAIARTLPNALHLVAPDVGHGVSLVGCAPSLIQTFFASGRTTGLDGGCLGAIPSPVLFRPIVTPGDE